MKIQRNDHQSDSFLLDLGDYYAILPTDGRLQQCYVEVGISFSAVPNGLLTTLELTRLPHHRANRELILENVDPALCRYDEPNNLFTLRVSNDCRRGYCCSYRCFV